MWVWAHIIINVIYRDVSHVRLPKSLAWKAMMMSLSQIGQEMRALIIYKHKGQPLFLRGVFSRQNLLCGSKGIIFLGGPTMFRYEHTSSQVIVYIGLATQQLLQANLHLLFLIICVFFH